jgi:alpha-tubulin suppressor-like RCC1 family protein
MVYGMGSNQYGKLGLDQNIKAQSTPKLIDSLSQHKIASVACGLNHALAVTTETGVVYSWGSGNQG